MNKRFLKLTAVMLALVVTLSGCSLLKINKEVDDQTVVAEFDGGQILKGKAMERYAEVEAYYESYGYTLTDQEAIQSIKQDLLNIMCEEQIKRAKADELNLTALTDDEKTDLTAEATSSFNDAVEYYKVYFEEGSDEETRQAAIDFLAEQNYTLEGEIEYAIENAWQEKLFDEVTKDVAATEEEILAAYDEMVAADQETYAESPYNFEYAVISGETVAWIPEGYRTVKHILIPFTEEQVAELDDLVMELEDVRYQLTDQTEEGDLPPDEGFDDDGHVHEGELLLETDGAADDTAPVDDAAPADDAAPVDGAAPADDAAPVDGAASADVVADLEPDDLLDEDFDDDGDEPVLTREELVAKEAELSRAYDALKAEFAATLQAKVDEVNQKIASGADFDQLIETYGEDPGMTMEPAMSQGYYVSANSQMWEEEFTRAAMALQKVGDVSAPVIGSSGIHIIRYHSDVPAGPVPLEAMREEVEQTALADAREAFFEETLEKWMAEANVKTYVDRMK